MNKSVLSQITYYLEDGYQKPVDVNNETTRFICQLIKIFYSYFHTYQYSKIYTRGKHTMIFVCISETYLELEFVSIVQIV